jgi:hypothetical protein
MQKDKNGDNFAITHLKSAISPLFTISTNGFLPDFQLTLFAEFIN